MGTSIPLMGQPAQITNPIQNVSQILNAKDLASQITLRQQQAAAQQAQTANVQAEAAQRQKDQNDQNVVQQAMQDPNQNVAFHKGDFSSVAGKVQPKTIALMQQEQAKLNESLLANTTAKNKQRVDALGQINDTLNGLSTLTGADGKPDLERINQALPSAINNLSKQGLFDQAGIDSGSLPTQITDIKQIPNAQAAIGGAMAAHQQVLAQQKTQAETAEAAGKGAQAQSEADIKAKQLAGMTPKGLLPEEQVRNQQAAATLAQTQQKTNEEIRHDKTSEATARFEAGTQATRAAAETSLAASAQGDRETNTLTHAHQANLTSAQSQMEKINEASTMLNSGNAETQALAVPKVLSALVSGQGSGVRITQPELNNVAHARGVVGDVQGWLQKVSSGKNLTDEQSNQLKGILSDVGNRIKQKMQISNDAINSIQSAPDKASKIAADQGARYKINALDSGAGTGVVSTSVPSPVQNVLKSAGPGIHTLSDGSKWMKDANGKITQK